MNFLEKIINTIFREKYPKHNLKKIHSAEKHKENWIFSLFDYKHPQMKNIIRHLKNHNDFLLKKELAQYMSDYVIDYISDQQELFYFIHPIIIPVPISKKRLRERGFNQVHLFAKYFAKNIDGIYEKGIVQKKVTTRKQALIKNRKDRFKNVQKIFSIRENKKHLIKNQDVIIVDDLSTTGATLLEMKKILQKHGARNIIAVTIAH